MEDVFIKRSLALWPPSGELVETLPLPAVLVGRDGRCLAANAAAGRLLQVDLTQVVGRPLRDFMADAGEFDPAWQQALAGQVASVAVSMRRADGALVAVRWSVVPPASGDRRSSVVAIGVEAEEEHRERAWLAGVLAALPVHRRCQACQVVSGSG